MNYRKIILFLLLTFSLSIVSWYVSGLFLAEDSMFLPFLRLMLYSWGPGLAALIVQRGIYGESMKRYGWNRKHFSLRWIGLAIGLPIGVIVGSLGLVYLLGNMMHLPGFGEVVLSDPSASIGIFYWVNALGIPGFSYTGLPPEIGSILALLLLLSTVGGLTVSLAWLSGQELGWRGFMLVETRSLGFLGSNLVIGGLIGLWLFPLMLFQQADMLALSPVDLFWELLSTIGFAIAIAFPAAWLAIRTRSIYASASLLGVFHNLAPLALFFTYDQHPLLGSPEGLAGMFVLLLVTFLILRFDRRMTTGYDEWVF
jgi:hypothetical protein